MSAFKLHTLRQKLWAVVAASFVARVVLFFALPGKPISVSTDEYAYAPLTEMTALGTLGQQENYYQDLYKNSRTLVLPASILYRAGIDQLDAIRIISSLYSLLSLIFVVLIALRFSRAKGIKLTDITRSDKLIFGFILVFAFFPSRFLWSVVGYRESANEFWIMCVFVLTYVFFFIGSKTRIPIAFLLGISLVFVFSSRQQVGLLLMATLLIASLFKIKERATPLFVFAVLVGSTAGYVSTTSFSVVASDIYRADETPTAAPTKEPALTSTTMSQLELEASRFCDGTSTTILVKGKIFKCTKVGSKRKVEGLENPASIAVKNIELIRYKQLINQKDAQSSIQTLYCPLEAEGLFNKIACLAWRAPYASVTFLFRPLPFVDTTSFTSYLAAAENILWVFGVFFLLYRLITKRNLNWSSRLLPVTIFLILYVVGAGSYQGNMGTAFRHKSLILWAVLLLIYSTLSAKNGMIRRKHIDNSQESAV